MSGRERIEVRVFGLVISLSPFAASDLPAVFTLLRTELPAHTITESAFVRKVLLDPNFEPDGAIVARDDRDNLAGFLLSITRKTQLDGGSSDLHLGWITLFCTRSDLTRQSIGSKMFEAAENRMRARSVTEIRISPYTPHYWTPGIDEAAYPAALEFLKKRGYAVSSRPLGMAVALTDAWSIPAWAIERENELNRLFNLQIAPVSPATVLPLMQFLAAEFPGDWQRHVRDSVQAIYSGYRRAEDVFVAMSGGEVWGFSHIEDERFGPFGVAASRRGLGVGAALLYRSLNSMRQNGANRAWFMWAGDEPAKRIYAPAGFAETNRYSIMVKRL